MSHGDDDEGCGDRHHNPKWEAWRKEDDRKRAICIKNYKIPKDVSIYARRKWKHKKKNHEAQQAYHWSPIIGIYKCVKKSRRFINVLTLDDFMLDIKNWTMIEDWKDTPIDYEPKTLN